MRLLVKENVLIAAQVVLIICLAWQLGTTTSWENAALVTALLVPILLLGVLRLMIRKDRSKSELEMIKGLQDSEKSAHELVTRLDVLTRREIAAWIHGDLQRALIKVGRSLRLDGHIEASDELVRISDEAVRAMSHKLYPPQLEVSLHLALTDLCVNRATLNMSDNLSLVMFKNFKSLIIPFELRLAAYRIVEEGLNNAEKKSDTKNISVSVEAVDNLLRISVLDDGNPLSDAPVQSLGLTLINTYVVQFDGNWKISNTESGVLLTASLSLPHVDTVEKMVADPLVQMRRRRDRE